MPSFTTIFIIAMLVGAGIGIASYYGTQVAAKTHQLLTWLGAKIHPTVAKVIAPVPVVVSAPVVSAPATLDPAAPDGTLSADGTHTKGATPTNAFAGFKSSDGGTFGGGASPDVASARLSFEAVSGVSADKLGLPPTATAADYDAMTRLFGGIASRLPSAITEGLASSNPYVRSVAQSYASR